MHVHAAGGSKKKRITNFERIDLSKTLAQNRQISHCVSWNISQYLYTRSFATKEVQMQSTNISRAKKVYIKVQSKK